MTEIGVFLINEDELPMQVFDSLAKIAPDWVSSFNSKRTLSVRANILEPKFQAVIKLLELNGFYPADSKDYGVERPQKAFKYMNIRTFDEQELLDAPYLNIALENMFAENASRSATGKMIVTGTKKPKLGYAMLGQYFVGQSKVCEELMSNGLKLEFREILKSEAPEVKLEGYYEITSTVRTPLLKVSTNLYFTNAQGMKYDGDGTKNWRLVERFQRFPQLHFSKSDFESIEPFDLAYTQEPLKSKWNVCSNKLFRILRKYDKKLNAIPIRLS